MSEMTTKDLINNIRICKYCGMELSEGIPHGLRECHLRAVARIAELEAERLELRKTLGWAYDLDEYKDNPEAPKEDEE